MATGTGTADRIFDALNESYEALLAAIKAGNERGYRVSKTLIDEAERGQKEVTELGRKFAQDPADLAGFSTSVMEATTKAQSRALDLTRQWFEELSGANSEARDAIQRVSSERNTRRARRGPSTCSAPRSAAARRVDGCMPTSFAASRTVNHASSAGAGGACVSRRAARTSSRTARRTRSSRAVSTLTRPPSPRRAPGAVRARRA